NRTLTPAELLAADVNNNSDVTALDASYILQHAVNLITLPFNGRNNIWAFNPPSRSYSPLGSDRTGQTFVGTLIGDVSGNFASGSTIGSTGEKAALAVGRGAVQPGAEVAVPITFTPAN